jgi:hypothetical protein
MDIQWADGSHVKPVEETRGFLKDIDTSIEREPDRL